MDQAFERIVNLIFYFILGCIVLAFVGIDPFALFVGVSGFLLGFVSPANDFSVILLC